MKIWEAILLGFVQGLSEYLPISSTAHIVVVQWLLGYEFQGLAFEVFLHLASVLAVIFFFRRDLADIIAGFFRYVAKRAEEDRVSFWFALYLVVATAITGILGIVLENVVADTIKTPAFIAAALAVTGILIIMTEQFKKYGNRRADNMRMTDAVMIGLAQTLAVLPGISRSGITLILALWIGLEKKTAVRFSFLLAVPVILGSTVLALRELNSGMWEDIGGGALVAAFVATFVFSVIGIKWLIAFLNRSKLIYFALYCFALAIFVFWWVDPDLIANR